MRQHPDRRADALDDPHYATFAWGRFRRIMAWMALAAILTVVAVLHYLRSQIGPLPLSLIIATSAGIGLSVLLGTALMGLVFLSSGTGHDEDVDAFNKEVAPLETFDD